jgi:hypothetical protein
VRHRIANASFMVAMFLLTCVIVGCQTMQSQSTAPSKAAVAGHEAYVARVRTAKALPGTLPGAAHLTYAAHNQARIAGHADAPPSESIPALYWAARIKELKPLRVYIRLSSLVVVQRETGQIEEGLYIQATGSILSFAGNAGDGFVLSQIEPGVFKFTREKKN